MEGIPNQPFIIDKNLGRPLDPQQTLTQTNADGLPAIELSKEETYLFDIRGWALFDGVLTGNQVKEMRDFCDQLQNDPESIPEPHRTSIGGPLEQLTDHPLVLGFMNEFVAHPPLASPECYGFRLEHSDLRCRKLGEGNSCHTMAMACSVSPAIRVSIGAFRARQTQGWSGSPGN